MCACREGGMSEERFPPPPLLPPTERPTEEACAVLTHYKYTESLFWYIAFPLFPFSRALSLAPPSVRLGAALRSASHVERQEPPPSDQGLFPLPPPPPSLARFEPGWLSLSPLPARSRSPLRAPISSVRPSARSLRSLPLFLYGSVAGRSLTEEEGKKKAFSHF